MHKILTDLADKRIRKGREFFNIKHKIEHNKFAIFDGVHMVSGSYNWTTNASKNNSENCVFFDQPNKEYSNRFEYLWNLYSK